MYTHESYDMLMMTSPAMCMWSTLSSSRRDIIKRTSPVANPAHNQLNRDKNKILVSVRAWNYLDINPHPDG